MNKISIFDMDYEQLEEKYGFKSIYKTFDDIHKNGLIDISITQDIFDIANKENKDPYDIYFELGYKPRMSIWNLKLITRDILSEKRIVSLEQLLREIVNLLGRNINPQQVFDFLCQYNSMKTLKMELLQKEKNGI